MSVFKARNKVYKLKTYEKVVNNPIYNKKCKDSVDKELFNLELYNMWEFKEMPSNQKVIRLKLVFKVKYLLNGSIPCFKARLIA